MNLQGVLAQIHPGWYCPPDACGQADAIDDALLLRARQSPLGRRLLARWLLAGDIGAALLAPAPGGAMAGTATRWPRPRLALLVRDLGALAYAPAIRAEVRRDPVRRLRQALGNGYLLALDKVVWNGRVDDAVAARLDAALESTLAAGEPAAAIHALLDHQGRSELQDWAGARDPALAQWCALLHPREERLLAHLPEKQVLFLHDHHLTRSMAS